jgi:hypothetical protein
MRSNRAQAGQTLTWFIAFIIIFFIITTFVYFSFAIGAKKSLASVFLSNDKVVGLEVLLEDSVMRSSLFAVLESKTVINGSTVSFLDLVTGYENYDPEAQLEIKNKLKIELDKSCDSYEFNVRDIMIANALIVNPTNELILPLNHNQQIIPIKYIRARSCK